MSKKVYIITGHSNQGKTTWIAGAIDFLFSNNQNFAGLFCPSDFTDGKKSAIDCVLLPEKKKLCLAKRKQDFSSGYSRKWKFDDDVIDAVNKHVENIKSCTYFICDEIGPLELIKGGGFTSAIKFMQSQNFKNAIVAIRPSMIEKFKNLFDSQMQFLIINVTEKHDYSILL